MKQETRTFSLRADGGSAADPQMLLRGRAVTYGAMSSDLGGFRERIQSGAFTRSLQSGTDVKADYMHDNSKILGRQQNGTLRLDDSAAGLDFAVQLDKNQSWHRDLWHSIQRRDLDGCSFAFNVDGDGEDFDEDEDDDGTRYSRRTISRAKLYSVSVVSHPAYPGATNVSARNLGQHGIDEGRATYEQLFLAKYHHLPNTPKATRDRVKLENIGALIRKDEAHQKIQLSHTRSGMFQLLAGTGIMTRAQHEKAAQEAMCRASRTRDLHIFELEVSLADTHREMASYCEEL
jgi:HK97 family phage prohead protease